MREPDDSADYSGFPVAALSPGATIRRAHSRRNHPCYYSSAGGRFGLSQPAGTIYAADDVETAVRERLREIVDAGVVPAALADQFAVTTLTVAAPHNAANVTHKAAVTFGVTRAICTDNDYSLSQKWSNALRRWFDGVRYASRFTSEPGPNSWALFGQAGVHPDRFEIGERVPGREACAAAGIPIQTPHSSGVLAITTPEQLWPAGRRKLR